MSQQELLKKVVAALDFSGIRYMLTGSFVSSLQGEPRSTHDIDVVVELDASAVDVLMSCFADPSFFLQRPAIFDAIARRSMFNLLSLDDGEKVDFWLLKDTPFDKNRFERRISERVLGIVVWMSRPEDTILAKLRWASLAGGSEKQLTDALRILEVQGASVDEEYLTKWAVDLGVDGLLQQLREAASPRDLDAQPDDGEGCP